MATCVRAVAAVAPCQCFTSGGIQITSPLLIAWGGCPACCTQPWPSVTISVCPERMRICQAVRAPGAKATVPPKTRAGRGVSTPGC